MLDDTPVVPGDMHAPFEHASEARRILNDAETELQGWHSNLEPIQSNSAGLGKNLMPVEDHSAATPSEVQSTADVETPASATGHHSSAVQDTTSPVQGEGTHLEKAMAA